MPSPQAFMKTVAILGLLVASVAWPSYTAPEQQSICAGIVSNGPPPVSPHLPSPPSAPAHWSVIAVGDVLLHQPLHLQALKHPLGHRSLWSALEPAIQAADIAYANFEGPAATGIALGGREVRDPGLVFDKRVYTSHPMFNYHASLSTDLVASGFDVVSTANNHALDRGPLGVDRTIEALRTAGLAFTGTRHRDEPQAPWFTMVERPGLRTAWLACSFSTNGLPDRHHQVLHCYQDEAQVLEQIRLLAASPDIDAVFVAPHWGNEYQNAPHPEQRRLGRAMIDAGALAVFGAHPHVPQPWERYRTLDGRDGFIIYSLGNFVSGQFHRLHTRASLMVRLDLARGSDGRVRIAQVSHTPLEMTREGGTYRVQPITDIWGTPALRQHLATMFAD